MVAGVEKSRKRRRDSVLKTPDEEFVPELPNLKLSVPDLLKACLNQDHHKVVQEQQLIPLPRTPSVSSILAEYMEVTLANTDADADEVEAVVDGLKLYFNTGLKNILLYRSERPQLNALLKKTPKAQACDIYGCEHFLRLFVQLPALVGRVGADRETAEMFQRHFNDILKFIEERREQYLLDRS
ncbi:Esa1p-associated factor [Geranomyces variabilis]|nr:Esa1p-associated factor [Geranomyces variabilis]